MKLKMAGNPCLYPKLEIHSNLDLVKAKLYELQSAQERIRLPAHKSQLVRHTQEFTDYCEQSRYAQMMWLSVWRHMDQINEYMTVSDTGAYWQANKSSVLAGLYDTILSMIFSQIPKEVYFENVSIHRVYPNEYADLQALAKIRNWFTNEGWFPHKITPASYALQAYVTPDEQRYPLITVTV